MTTSAKEAKERRIKRETARLRKLLEAVPPHRLAAADGLIRRCAFMRVTLEDLEADINERGAVEPFSQGAGIIYDRERPAAKLYTTLVQRYTVAAKQLLDLLPDRSAGLTEADELMEFIKRRSPRLQDSVESG